MTTLNLGLNHENEKHPPLISELEELELAVKSDLVECLEQLVRHSQMAPLVDVKFLDDAEVIHLLKPCGYGTLKICYIFTLC